jgi:hypothetical protein
MKMRLTKTAVEAIVPGPRDVYAWDEAVPGFGCKVMPNARHVYVLKYRANGGQRWLTLGRHGEITTEQARIKAENALRRRRAAVSDVRSVSKIHAAPAARVREFKAFG